MIAIRRSVATLVAATAVIAAFKGATPDVDRAVRSITQPDGVLHDARLLMLLAATGLVAALPGLLRGRRGAWWVAITAAFVVAGASVLDGTVVSALVLGSTTAGVLVVARRWFAAPADSASAARAVRAMIAGLIGVFVYASVGTFFLDANFHESTTIAGSVYDGFRMMILAPTSIVNPATVHGTWFVDSVRLLAFLVVLVGLARISIAVFVASQRTEADRRHVARLLAAYGDSALAPFLLLDDKSWVFAPDGEAVIGFRVVASVAVALGGPVGADRSRRDAVMAFRDHCDAHGWVPVFHQVRDEDRADLEAGGLRFLKIGEEAVIPLDEFGLEGSPMKSLRSTLKRVERVGSTFEVLPTVDDATLRELHEVSDAWLATGGHRERTFSVGRFDAATIRSTEIAVVRDREGRIIAFANILPRYRCDLGNVDLMRRRPDCVNGVMEFLFVRLIELFRDRGCTGMTLGLAPLSGVQGPGLADRFLRVVRTYGEGSFNFAGLREFKAKWHPRWEPRYVAYRRERDLPTVALGIARVGELPPARRRSRVGDACRRYPFSVAMLGLALWLTLATGLDRRIQRVLVGTFGLSWPDLRRAELWRIATTSLISPRAGFVWSNLLLLAVVLPLAERRFGTARTALAFFAGDVTASAVALVCLRIAAALGSHTGALGLVTRDVGQSAGAWSVAAALAVATRRPRRGVWIGVVAFVLVGQLVVFHRLFDLQHVVAALVGAGLARWWSVDRAAEPVPDAPEILARA